MSFVNKNNALIFLLLNACLWGSSYIWSKMLLDYLPRFSILFLCSVGGLATTLLLFGRRLKGWKKGEIRLGIIVSLFSIASNTLCMFALQYTSSSNTAFIVQLSVIITPLFMAVYEGKAPRPGIIVSALAALSGLFILVFDFNNFSFKIGDLLAFGNAVFFSLFLASQNIFSKKLDPVRFTFVHQATTAIGFFTAAFLFERNLIKIKVIFSPVFAVLLSVSIFITIFTILFQSAAIRHVRPEKASVIYTFEPVAALFLGVVFLGERLQGVKHLFGCLLILAAVFISLYRRSEWRKQPGDKYKKSALIGNAMER